MLNFSSESTRRTTFNNQFSTTFRRIFNPLLLNGRKSKTKDLNKTSSSHSKSNKLIEECKNSKVYPASDHPIEINLNVPNSLNEEKDCPICFLPLPKDTKQLECGHSSCDNCLIKYLKTEISESRVSIKCPECEIIFHPNRIQELLCNDQHYLNKYEEFMIRKVLITDPDTRFCPAPDCSFALIAKNCSKCPILRCGREKCNTLFCYNCQKKCTEDHRCKKSSSIFNSSSKNKTKSSRKLKKKSKSSKHHDKSNDKSDAKPESTNNDKSNSSDDQTTSIDLSSTDDDMINLKRSEFIEKLNMKQCPTCSILIIKIHDGSCNHMTCSLCGCQFCWLCIKKTSELHFLSPTGCTFFGKKQWSKKKKLFWQLGMLLGAPVFIALSAAIAIPSIVIGVPVWFGRKLQNSLKTKKLGKFKKCVFVTSGVISSVVISPILAAGAVAIGVPFLLAYVYGIVPITLCRSKAQMNEKEQPMKISDEEAQAFIKQLSEKDSNLINEKVNKKSSKKVSLKDKENRSSKSKDKYKLFDNKKSSIDGSNESVGNQSTKTKKGSLNEFIDYDISYIEADYSDSRLSANSSRASFSSLSSSFSNSLDDEFKTPIKDNSKIVEIHNCISNY